MSLRREECTHVAFLARQILGLSVGFFIVFQNQIFLFHSLFSFKVLQYKQLQLIFDEELFSTAFYARSTSFSINVCPAAGKVPLLSTTILPPKNISC